MRAVFLMIGVVLLLACNKKKNSTSNTNSTGGIPHTNAMTAKVNGNAWDAHQEGFTISKTTVFNFSGQTSPSSPYSLIAFSFPLTTSVGICSFGNSGTVIAKFRDTLGVYFSAKTGTINITDLDTFSYGPKKIKATFSFNTDTVGGKSYSLTSGVVDFRL